MNVILLKDVDKVGLRGDVVSVTRGYARNFLLPRKLAEEATDARVAELRKRESQRARHEASTAEQAEAIAKTLRGPGGRRGRVRFRRLRRDRRSRRGQRRALGRRCRRYRFAERPRAKPASSYMRSWVQA